jgi:O-antigen ligase
MAAMASERLTDPTLTQVDSSAQSNGEGPGRPSAWDERAGALAAILPTGLVVLLLVLATSYDGAFHLRHWGPTALLAVVTLLAMHLAGGAVVPAGPIRIALVAIWAFAGWTLLSATWAESASLAWQGADRTILYAALATLALLTVAPARRLALVGYAVVAGIAILALVTLLRMRANGPDLFLAGRLDSPVGYRNGTAALFAFPVWPLVVVAAVRGRRPPLRAAAFAAAVLCLGLAFVTQSRGVALGLVCGGAVALALGPDRVRRAWLALFALGVVAIVSGPLLEPYDAFTAGQGPANADAISHAASALTLATLGAFAGFFLASLLDNGLRAPQLERGRHLAAAGLAVVVLVGLIGGLAVVGNPVSYAKDKWDEFRDVNPSGPLGATRLGSVGGQRYDLYRVGMREWRDHPLNGVGEGNYAFDYYRQRETDRNLTDPHSLPIRLLAETGLVGALLFLAFLAALAAAIARGWRATPPDVRRSAVALVAGGAVVVGQQAVDWLWLIPGITGLGLFALALSTSVVASGPEAELPRLPGRRGPLWAAVAVGLVLAGVSVLLPFLADVHERRARANEGTDPAQVLSEARSAERLDPWSVVPHYLQAGALEDLRRVEAAHEELLQALDLEPRNWATLGILGDFEARRGNVAEAKRWYRRALALNPLDLGLQKLAAGKFRGEAE